MLNKIISLVMMIMFIPIFFIIGLIIVIDDGFPIFFLQKRIGKNKKLFHIIKFRTMNNNTKDIATHLVKNYDNKILRSGNFLRKYSLDELPQIINVIFGDINFIGPRPALFNQHDLIELREKYNIHSIKPGITGWAQVNGRDSLSIKEKVRYDDYYVKNKSFILDIKILYKTIFKVFFAKDISG